MYNCLFNQPLLLSPAAQSWCFSIKPRHPLLSSGIPGAKASLLRSHSQGRKARGSGLHISTEDRCFKLLLICPEDPGGPHSTLPNPTSPGPRQSAAFALRHQRPPTGDVYSGSIRLGRRPLAGEKPGAKTSRRTRQTGRERKWARWGGQQWDSSFECTGDPEQKGVQWSFRTCPSLVHSFSVSFFSQNRSRERSGKSCTGILINCKPIEFFHWPRSLSSTNSVNAAWRSQPHFSSSLSPQGLLFFPVHLRWMNFLIPLQRHNKIIHSLPGPHCLCSSCKNA